MRDAAQAEFLAEFGEVEQHLDKVNIQPIVDMIREVETKVNSLQASSALIIE